MDRFESSTTVNLVCLHSVPLKDMSDPEHSSTDSATRRIRVAHLITDLGLGGAETQLHKLVMASNGSPFEHLVISMTEIGPLGESLRAAGVEVLSLGMTRGMPTPGGVLRLWRLLASRKPDVLQCWLYHSCLLGLLAGRLARVRRIVWCLRSANDGLAGYGLQTRAVVRLCGLLSSLPDAIVPNSEAGRALHARWGYSSKKMQVIPNGIELELFRPEPAARASVREELNVPDDALLVGMVARFHPMKDHGTFLRAAQLVHSRLANTRFVLVGSGITRENTELCRMVEECGLADTVYPLGPRMDIPRITAALDVACLSSWSESSPSVICEAMSCGVPCVATDVGECRVLVGDTGKIVAPRNPQALADALLSLLQLPSEQLSALGQRARNRASMFSLDRVVGTYRDLYVRLTEPDRSPCAPDSLVAQGSAVQINSRHEITAESATEEVRP